MPRTAPARSAAPPLTPLTLPQVARTLLAGGRMGTALARSAGLRDAAALERALKRELHLSSDALAGMRTGHYRFPYGAPFHVEQTLRYLARDPHNCAERVQGATYRRWFPIGDRTVLLSLTLARRECEATVQGRLSPASRLALHGRLVRFLGLDQPLQAFYDAVRDDAVMGPLVRRLRGVRIPQVPSLWEALCWAIIGQQINLAFAYRLRNRFIALGQAGPAAQGAHDANGAPLPFPSPEHVLRIPAPAWREAQFSRQKIAYLIGVAEAFQAGTLSEAALDAADEDDATATLSAVKGLGPWSVAYGLLRALGRVDALPVGDAGLRAALRHHYGLSAAPDARTQIELMERFRPYRGLATYYFWKALDHLRQE